MHTDEETTEISEVNVIENGTELCRSCLSTNSLNNILELHFEEIPFVSIFCELLATTVSNDDHMPKNICKNCIGEIISFYEFKKKFNQSEEILKVLCATVKNSETCEEFDSSEIIEENLSFTANSSKTVEVDISENNRDVENGNSIDSEADKIETEIANVKNDLELNNVSDLGTFLLNTKIICKGCNRKFTILEIKRHTCTVCYICKRNLKRLPALRVHMNSHTNARPYMCEYCGRGFNSATQLIRHNRIHTGEKPYKCDFCDKTFRVRSSCVSHMRHIHMKIENPKKSSSCVCPICGLVFVNRLKCTLHIKSHSKKNNLLLIKPKHVKKLEKPTKFLCEICSRIYKTKQALEEHLESHGEKKYTCTICDKKFATKNILYGHVKVHNAENSCVCHYCGKCFKYEGILRGHLRLHTGTNYKYKCEVCNKRFPTNNKLEVHMRSHTGEKPFDCSYCGKSFGQKVNLKVHERIHTGERPYKCVQCQKRFATTHALKRHKRNCCRD